ncbi:GntR family transcriptional regulator [Fodinicola acaciae]|uniref:GntR family transcriptional regulator n=1 Tax=Fodinicola acaciae TaxID=2681555 RepID=UPI0013D71B54|nr:GntR family transcriptional regulator [Fodinicola acaciae]
MTTESFVVGDEFHPRPDSAVPMHVQIEQWLGGEIVAGHLTPGDRLPPERQLAASLQVSRMTLRQALAALERRELLVRTGGRSGGTFVAQPKVECDLTGLTGFTEQLRRSNLEPGARVLTAERLPATAVVASALNLDEGADVFEIIRVRLANRRPLALECSYFPAAVCPDMLSQPLTGSLYALLTTVYGQQPTRAFEALSPVIASANDAEALEIEPGQPLMMIERTAYARSGLALEYARDLFRGDRTKITVWSGGEPTD